MIKIRERDISIDILKGILISFVVIGHYPAINDYLKNIIYWFHMPIFFIISGYLYNERISIDKEYIVNTFKKLIIPYLSYFFLITILIEKNLSIKRILVFLYGGRMYPGVYWFIPCLILTTIIFNIIVRKFSKTVSILIVFGMGILANLESIYYIPQNTNYGEWSIIYKIPLNLDVCLLSIVYFMIGFYGKKIIHTIKKDKYNYVFLLISIVIFIIIIYQYVNSSFNYEFDMKYSKYDNLLLNITIPLLSGYILLMISKIIENTFLGKKVLVLGRNTLPIMFLHIPINAYIMNYISYNLITYTALGIIIPLIFSYICSRNYQLSKLFIGKQVKQKSKIIKEDISDKLFI